MICEILEIESSNLEGFLDIRAMHLWMKSQVLGRPKLNKIRGKSYSDWEAENWIVLSTFPLKICAVSVACLDPRLWWVKLFHCSVLYHPVNTQFLSRQFETRGVALDKHHISMSRENSLQWQIHSSLISDLIMVGGKISSPSSLQKPGLVTDLNPGILRWSWLFRKGHGWDTMWEALETLHCC